MEQRNAYGDIPEVNICFQQNPLSRNELLELLFPNDADMTDPSTGARLAPGDPEHCQGNGEHPNFEICCDNCDYWFECFDEHGNKLR